MSRIGPHPHSSDCSLHNGPALEVDRCDCGAAFRDDLTEVIGRHWPRMRTDIPEHIIADYLHSCIHTIDRAIKARDAMWQITQRKG